MVVSNTSPLINLALIGQLDLLPQLYTQVVIPEAVWHEIVIKGAGQIGATEIQAATWVVKQPVQNNTLVQLLKQTLDAGEAEAIALALETQADLLLIDERLGRLTAKHLGVTYTGLIGLFIEAKRKHLIATVKPNLDKLRQVAGFYISEALYQQILFDQREQ